METNVTREQIEEVVSVLTPDEQQILKDAINFGSWGNCDYEFMKTPHSIGNGNVETVSAWGYCTNDASEACHFSGRKISALFRSIYRKLCPESNNQVGYAVSHCRNWWDDGSGDMLFVREEWSNAFEDWAMGR